MRGMLSRESIDRLLFGAIAIGVALAAYGGWRYVDLANQLAGNAAAQIHESGAEVKLESKGQAQGLMAADIERRRLVERQMEMMVIGGFGLALLGLGWLGMDLRRGRRLSSAAGKEASAQS